MCACGYVCICRHVCIDIYACMHFFTQTFILLGLHLALASFFDLKTVSSILRCCLMPTKNIVNNCF